MTSKKLVCEKKIAYWLPYLSPLDFKISQEYIKKKHIVLLFVPFPAILSIFLPVGNLVFKNIYIQAEIQIDQHFHT